MIEDSKQHRDIEMKIIGHITTDIDDIRFLRERNISRDFFYYKSNTEDYCLTQTLFEFAMGYYRDNDRLLSREALITELSKRGEPLSEGSSGARLVALLMKCQTMNLDKNSFPALLDKLREDSVLRILGGVTSIIAENTKTPSKAFEAVFNHLSNARVNLSSDSAPTKVFNVSTGMEEIYKEYQKRKENKEENKGLEVGWRQLDNATNGFKPSTLVLVIGEVGKGKSTILLNWASEINNRGKNVIFFSFEMPMWQVKARWAARQIKLPYSGFMHGELDEDDEEKLEKFYKDQIGGDEGFDRLQSQSKGYFIIVDQPDDTSPAFVEQIVKQYNSLYGPCDAIFADYLNNMKADDIGRNSQWWEQTGLAAKGLRRIARVHNLVAFSAQQINREGLKYGRKQMKDDEDISSFTIHPEHIEGWKEVINSADSVIGFTPNDALCQMHIYRIKGRDWTCNPFTVRFDAPRCYVGSIDDDDIESAAALFDDGMKRSIIGDMGDEMDNIDV